jgi:hypothetical protein
MSATLKVRLRAGDREIEIEGNRSDVDDLLSKWWTNTISAEDKKGASENDNPAGRIAKSPKRKGPAHSC